MFEVGVFSAEPGKKGFNERSVIAFEKRAMKGGKTVVSFVTGRLPTHVGVDPYNKRIDRNSDDNLTALAAP